MPMLVVTCAVWLLGLALAESNSDSPHAGATEVRHFSFEFEDDQDYDHQPDDWKRRRGTGFPHYVVAEIDRQTAAHGRQSLRFDVNGGQAVYYSPLIHVDNTHSFVLEAYVKTRELKHDAALVSVSLLDHKRRRLKRLLSSPVTGTHKDWVRVRIGPFTVEPDVGFVVLGCHVAPSERSDFRGQVWFDHLWLGSLPRLVLSTSQADNYHLSGASTRIQVEALGLMPDWTYRAQLELQAPEGEVLQRHAIDLPPSASRTGSPPSRRFLTWELPPQPNGFYRVSVQLQHEERTVLHDSLTFVVMEPAAHVSTGEFGWSLPDGAGAVRLERLPEITRHASINWLKYPLWSGGPAESADRSADFSLLMDRLEAEGITLVGLLNHPPAQLEEKFGRRLAGMSKLFTLPRDLWYPSLEPLIARYSFRVRHWQLGDDTDNSFVGLPALSTTVGAVKREFDRIGHDSRMGFHWTGESPLPKLEGLPHTFVTLTADPGTSPDGLRENLPAAPPGVHRWLILKPLSRNEARPGERAADLARRMIAARLGGVEVVLADNPLDPDRGLLNADGTPGELFLPWRTTALALRGMQPLGALELPQRSPNAVFARGKEVLVAIWNDQPTTEELSLGEDVRVYDLWGRRQAGDGTGSKQTLDVGPSPLLLRGCAEGIVRWMLATRFEHGQLRSEYGVHEEALLVTNTFPQGVSGKATLHMPHDWEVEPSQWTLQAAAGEAVRLPMLLSFPPDASFGKLRPKVDFEIAADRPYRFSVFLPYQLGVNDVELHVEYREKGDGWLEVEQRIVNHTDPLEILNFNCSLFIPGQIRQKQLVTKLGLGEDRRFYHVPDAEGLLGKRLWLRVEQIDGRRVLNYHWTMGEPKTPATSEDEAVLGARTAARP